jgi:phosphatidylinositol-3-phosphatase
MIHMKARKQLMNIAATLGILGSAQVQAAPYALQQIKTVFVIAMENHNFTQPSSVSSPEPILGNAAAPYLNSLVTPGNSNAVQVSYATRYFNSGVGVHPSEPNYVWDEAGSDFGYHSDNDPVSGVNLYTVPHFTGQLTTAGVPWKNYQENVSLSSSPEVSASGTSTTVINPYYHTGQYNYGVKHNPMAFFTDTDTKNVYELSNLFTDLNNNTVGRYNWITPNQYDDAHSALNGSFTYAGHTWTGDQSAIAQGDNFLATVVPQIMASQAYQSNGVVIIWFDETEGGDTTNFSLPEFIISPLAKGNAYASTLEYNHSSDLKTMEEIFGLSFVSNSIPASETNVKGTGYNFVASVNDLSDLFIGTTGTTTIGNLSILPSQPASMTLFGSPGESYSVIASDNLLAPRSQWSVIGGGVFSSNTAPFIDTDAINHTNRFYSLILK